MNANSATIEHWLTGHLRRHDKSDNDVWLRLRVDVLDLAGSRPELAAFLLESPERFRQAVIAALARAARLDDWRCVWLRPERLPAPLELSVPDALAAIRASPATLLACYGICMAASAVYHRTVRRDMSCPSCSRVWTVFSDQAMPSCCGLLLQEVESARMMVQAQAIQLTSHGPKTCNACTHLGGSLLTVHLLDDLCGLVRVGDHVLVNGMGSFCYPKTGQEILTAQAPLTLRVQLEAYNVEVLQLSRYARDYNLDTCHLDKLASLHRDGLQALLDVLDTACPLAASQLLKLSLLLSCAASGPSDSCPEAHAHQTEGWFEGAEMADDELDVRSFLPGSANSRRRQVHVMLTAAAPEPHINRFMDSLAALMGVQSVCSMDPTRMLPSLDPKFSIPGLGLQVPLAKGGQLAEASGGILQLHSPYLDAKRAQNMGQIMAAGQAVLQIGPQLLSVPLRSTIWTMMHQQDLPKGGWHHPAGGAAVPLSLTERIISHFSYLFFSQHDIVLACGPETEDEVDAMCDSFLVAPGQGTGGQQAVQQEAARTSLTQHLKQARAAAQPALSEAAGQLLEAYFLHLRGCKGGQRGVLDSLLRVAAACARLRHSASVEVLPDAALAVAFLEEKLLAAGASPVFWPRWREELQRCTELAECLRGLAEEVCKGLGLELHKAGAAAGRAPEE